MIIFQREEKLRIEIHFSVRTSRGNTIASCSLVKMSSIPDNSQTNNLNNAAVYLYKYVVPVIYILGNMGNFASFLIFLKKSWKKNVCVFYFKFCLLFNSCFVNSAILARIFMYGFGIYLQNSSVLLCKLYFYAFFLFISLSPTILILASIDRLLISSQNVDTRLYSSKRLAYFSISLSTVFWSIFYMHTLIMSNIQENAPSSFVCSYNTSKLYSSFVTYFSAVINGVFCLIMFVLCMFAFKNVRRIRAIPRDKRTQQLRSMTKKDFQLLRCLFVQDIVYIFFSMIFILFYIYQTVAANERQTAWELALLNFLSKLIAAFYYMYFCSSFFIFVTVSKAFRHELKRVFYKIIGIEFHPMREEEARPDNSELNRIPTIQLTP